MRNFRNPNQESRKQDPLPERTKLARAAAKSMPVKQVIEQETESDDVPHEDHFWPPLQGRPNMRSSNEQARCLRSPPGTMNIPLWKACKWGPDNDANQRQPPGAACGTALQRRPPAALLVPGDQSYPRRGALLHPQGRCESARVRSKACWLQVRFNDFWHPSQEDLQHVLLHQ